MKTVGITMLITTAANESNLSKNKFVLKIRFRIEQVCRDGAQHELVW
jgi:hypothetical protein